LSSLAELAEDIELHLPLSASVERVELPDCVVVDQRGFPFPPAGGVHRLRLAGERVEERVAELRAFFRERGRERFTWWVGSSATPSDLESRLLELGAEPYGDDPVITMMIAEDPPPEVDGIEVRRVERLEDFALAREIAWLNADFTEEEYAQVRAQIPERWAERERTGNGALFLAYVDGEPAAAGDMLALPFAGFLSGAATVPGYRGRGAFRALVRARWDEAVRRGTPALIVGAGGMSRPILERIGFEPVAEQHLLLDRSGLST
jgi:hypothetical protein